MSKETEITRRALFRELTRAHGRVVNNIGEIGHANRVQNRADVLAVAKAAGVDTAFVEANIAMEATS